MLHDSVLLTLLALTIFSGSCEKPDLLRMKNALLDGTHTRILSLTFAVLVPKEICPTEGLPCTADRKLL